MKKEENRPGGQGGRLCRGARGAFPPAENENSKIELLETSFP